MAISSNATGLRPGVVTSTTRPTNPYTGQLIFETDTFAMRYWSGSEWIALGGLQTLRSITGASDTPVTSDNGKLVLIDTSSGAVTITVGTSLALSAGQSIDFVWQGAATSVTFSGSGVTLNGTPGLKLRARYSAATLICTASNTYILVGDLIA